MPERRFALRDRLAQHGLPPPADDTLDALHDILDERVLGASNHVSIALPLVARIAAGPSDDTLRAALVTSDFIAETRGAAAPIVANALRWQAAGVDAVPPAEAAARLEDRAAAWAAGSKARRAALVDHARMALSHMTAPMLFDYSSTVADIICALGPSKSLRALTIPESRAIDGGSRYLDALRGLDVPIRFIPDAAIDWAIEQCDAVLLGAESVTNDGGILNTIGSVMAARSAAAAGIPVYGAADLFKVGQQSSSTLEPPPLRSYRAVLGAEAGVETSAPELELVLPSMISAILTEHGPLRSEEIADKAAEAIRNAALD